MNEIEYCQIQDYTMPELPPSNPANDYGHYKGSAANHGYIFENIEAALNGGGEITTNALGGFEGCGHHRAHVCCGKSPIEKSMTIANVVLNDFTRDNRVLKISQSLQAMGHDVTVVALSGEGLSNAETHAYGLSSGACSLHSQWIAPRVLFLG